MCLFKASKIEQKIQHRKTRQVRPCVCPCSNFVRTLTALLTLGSSDVVLFFKVCH